MASPELWKDILTDPAFRERYLRYVEEWEQRIGAFLEFDPERSSPGVPLRSGEGSAAEPASGRTADGMLSGMPFAVKDNIAVSGFHLTCGSRMLEGVVSPYTATAVARLQAAGAVVVGKTNLDEFGMGSSTENSAFKQTSNPWDTDRVPGGSSGGSAAAVAAGMVPFALGSDTGGSVRQPAAFCGVYGLKPTYGVVSRYGLVAYASSLEGIGVLSGDLAIAREVFRTMRGLDPLDHSTVDAGGGGANGAAGLPGGTERSGRGPAAGSERSGRAMRIGVLSNLGELAHDVAEGYHEAVEKLRKLGEEVVEVELPTLEYVVPAYYTIAMAEASANLARFNGIRYGNRPEWAENPEELMRKSRHQGFGPEVKLRILLGTYVLRSGFQDQYYVRAQKIRTAIRNDFAHAFEGVDTILMPVFPTSAFKRGEAGLTPFQQKLADKFTVTANLAGIPALTFPAAVSSGVPVGLQFLAPAFEEELLFSTVERCAEVFPFPHPEGFRTDWRA